MKLPDDAHSEDGPNLTPVIDVVFLLLIFFLVATTYAQQERELDVDLPETAMAQPLSDTKDLIVNITDDGTYKIAGKAYGEPQLLAVIQEANRNNPTQQALIRGDGDSALKHAARVMSMCNTVEMKYRIAVEADE